MPASAATTATESTTDAKLLPLHVQFSKKNLPSSPPKRSNSLQICLRVLFGVCCGVMVFFGVVFLGVSIGAAVNAMASVKHLFITSIYSGVIAALGIHGALILLTAVFGCCLTFHIGRFPLRVFVALELLVMLGCIAGMVGGFLVATKDSVLQKFELNMYVTMQDYRSDATISTAWDVVQKQYECCGVRSDLDWLTETDRDFPASCCKTDQCSRHMEEHYEKGCFPTLTHNLYRYANGIAGLLFLLVLLQLFMMWNACCIGKKAFSNTRCTRL